MSRLFGNHQAARPNSAIAAGTRAIRTTKASTSTPTASAKPIGWTIGSWPKTNEPNTATMISAAAVTTRAPFFTPATTASRGAMPCTWCSFIPETRNSS